MSAASRLGASMRTLSACLVNRSPMGETRSISDANSIPWLLVNIVTHEGSGVLSRATTIQRLNTKGGKAPASGCDAAHVGQEVRAPYSADYLFFAPK